MTAGIFIWKLYVLLSHDYNNPQTVLIGSKKTQL
jgi:hypothetical protein